MKYNISSNLFRTILGHRYLPDVLAVAALVISLPIGKAGWEFFDLDDFLQKARLSQPSQLPDALRETGIVPEDSGKVFTILNGIHNSDVKKAKDYGIIPWWTDENYQAICWRPLDGFIHWVDYRLFPDSVVTMRLLNLICFSAVIFVMTIVYRRFIANACIAGLAALLYLLDANHFFATFWIPSRHILITLFLGGITLLAYHRWCSKNSLFAGFVACICFSVSLLLQESAIATFAYIFAYTLSVDQAKWSRKLANMTPYFLIIIIWRIVYNILDYGARNSSFFIDPGYEPLRYILAVLKRGPIYLMGQIGWQPADIISMLPGSIGMYAWLIAVLFIFLLFIVIYPLLLNDRIARFWFTAILLSVLPICATVPANRQLVFVAIGAFGLMAQFVGSLYKKERWLPKSRLWRICAFSVCIILLALHIPMTILERAVIQKVALSERNRGVMSVMNIGSQVNLDDKILVIINTPSPFFFPYVPTLRYYNGQSLPKRIRMLAPGFGDIKISRVNENRLLLQAQSGNLLSVEPSSDSLVHWVYLYKNYCDAFHNGTFWLYPSDKVMLPGVVVEVVAVDENGWPTEVSFDFKIPLEDSSLKWIYWDWQKNTYFPFNIPVVGMQCEIAGPF